VAEHVLDNPAWHALDGPQVAIAETFGHFRRYPPDVAFFGATATAVDREHLADHLPPDAITAFWTTEPFAAPEGLEIAGGGTGLQMVAERYRSSKVTVAMRPLGDSDVPAMLELVRVTQPGPFLPRTHSLGRYLGVFDDDRLIAMTGERMKPAGYTEVSAVCTHPDYRGRGLAKALITAVTDAILERDDIPMLHVVSNNASAIAVYESLGYVARRTLQVTLLRHSGGEPLEEPEYLRRH
jgi:GNAT superfamily N-acetyltransferase